MEKFRMIVLSYWTAGALGDLATLLHVRWYAVDMATGAEVVSGFGAVLVVIGVFVGSRPYFRTGVAGLIEAGLPKGGAWVFGGPTYEGATKKLRDEARPQVTRDVWAERVTAVVVIVVGALLNYFGPFIARLFVLRGS